jgi:DNA recombination protein RmuC
MEFVIGAAMIAAAIVFVAWLFFSRATGGAVSQESIAVLQRELQGVQQTLNAQISTLTNTVNTQLATTNDQMFRQLSNQFSESQRLVTGVRDAVKDQLTELARRVGETQQATQQVFSLADQLKKLERVLTSQKQRGNLGEAGLALVLGNTLGPPKGGNYNLQHMFANGDRVDAVIMMPDGKIIPIDAKFPLENYLCVIDESDSDKRAEYENRFKNDLKNRIDETAKYVRPDEKTVDFAFMFIPAEAIYYDLMMNEVGAVRANTRNLVEYAHEKKVIIVSPTTFAAYLQTVLMGFRAFTIERAALEIEKNVQTLGRHLNAYQEFFNKIGNSLSTTVGHYNNATRELSKIDKDVLKITGSSPALAVREDVERPRLAAE